jgi:hypothetical protein
MATTLADASPFRVGAVAVVMVVASIMVIRPVPALQRRAWAASFRGYAHE